MRRYRTADEIRRYDLMKLGVLLLLILLLILTWLATREAGVLDMTGAAEPTAVAEATLEREPGTMPAPTLALPSVDVPVGRLTPGAVTLSGHAGAGAQVAVLADGRPLGLATAGVDGAWALTTDLPAGQHTITVQTLDNVGTIVAESAPLTITVGEALIAGGGDATAPAVAGELPAPVFDPLADTWTLSGTAAPNAAVAILAGGAPVAETTADAAGAWTLAVPGANVSGDVIVQATDAAGAIVSTPLTIGARPPSVAAPGQTALPAAGAVIVVPVGPGVWTGQAAPGTQVEAIVDDQSAGATSADAQGNWSLSLALPAGQHTLRFNSLDPAGVLLSAGTALAVTAGEGEAVAATPEGAAPAETPVAGATDTIAAVLRARPEFATLVRAIDAAGLGDALAQPGPFTVFAPTEAAFVALPQSVVDALLANPEALAAVLRYHVAQGRHTAVELRTVQPSTIDGRLLTVTMQADGQAINGALMTETDIAAGNGIIHAIDRILLPPLAAGVRPPIIDESGVPTFVGPRLTVVGKAEPGRTIRVELNGEAFGDAVVVDANGGWQVSGDVSAAEYRIVAFMLNGATLEAFSRPVALTVR